MYLSSYHLFLLRMFFQYIPKLLPPSQVRSLIDGNAKPVTRKPTKCTALEVLSPFLDIIAPSLRNTSVFAMNDAEKAALQRVVELLGESGCTYRKVNDSYDRGGQYGGWQPQGSVK